MPKHERFPNATTDDSLVNETTDPRAKVVIVSPAHPTYSDVRVFQKEARTLALSGYVVTLYALAEGKNDAFVEDDVRVVPLRHRSRGRMVIGLPRLLRRLLAENADVYHLHNPFSIPLVVGLKAAGKRVIFDVHEDFFERIPIREWLPRLVRLPVAYVVRAAEGVVGRMADGAIATQVEVAERLGPGTVLLENAPMMTDDLVVRSEAFARTLADDVAKPDGAFRLIYAGSLSRVRGLPAMMDALSLINDEFPARLWLVGSSDDERALAEARRHPAWGKVDFVGRLEHQHEVYGYMQRADVGLALFRDWGGYARISSNKLYEYMAAGIPFIASAFPLWQEQLEAVQAGFFCAPTDAAGIAARVLELERDPLLAQRMAEQGRQFIRLEFNWDNEKMKLLALYRRVLSRGEQAAGPVSE